MVCFLLGSILVYHDRITSNDHIKLTPEVLFRSEFLKTQIVYWRAKERVWNYH